MLRKELQINTPADLLYHYPYRYFDRTQLIKIADVSPAAEYVQVAGTLVNIYEEGVGHKSRLVATLYDDSGKIELVWFQAKWVKKSLKENERYVVF